LKLHSLELVQASISCNKLPQLLVTPSAYTAEKKLEARYVAGKFKSSCF